MILKFPEDIYNITLTLYIWDKDKFEKHAWEQDDSVGMFYAKHKQCHLYLKELDHQTLVHELIHCVMYVFDYCWVTISYDNDEVFAYYFDYYYGMIIKKLKKKVNLKSSCNI